MTAAPGSHSSSRSSRRNLRLLLLGGTSWLGGLVATLAHQRGHEVTCLARGESGSVPEGVTHVRADRRTRHAYDEVADRGWDVVLDVTWQPDQVRSALAALAARARHWIYVSSISVYADHRVPDADETAAVLEPWPGEGEADDDAYGPAKVSCETSCRALLDPDRLLVVRAGLIVGYGDRSDRFGYWPGRLASVEDRECVLVPPLDSPVQVVDVTDLARWLVDAAEARVAGVYDAVGAQITLADVVSACAAATGNQAVLAEPDEEWLIDQQVSP
jgi:2'-hydroxyisoflavone reductase